MKQVTFNLLALLFLVTGCGSFSEVGNNLPPGKSDIALYIPNQEAKLVGFRGTEPQGFNGITWGTHRSTVQGLKHSRTDSSYGGIEFYSKEGEVFNLNDGKNTPVEFGFWRGEFCVGMVTVRGPDEWKALKKSVFDQFWVGAKPFSNKEEYLWVGEDAVMALRYTENLRTGVFYIRSTALQDRMEKAEN